MSGIPQPAIPPGHMARVSLGGYEEAIPHFQQAEQLGSPAPRALALRLAQAYAGRSVRADDAFAQLKRATDAGLGILPPPLDVDPGLSKLKSGSSLQDVRNSHGPRRQAVRGPRSALPRARLLDRRESDMRRGQRAAPMRHRARSVITRIHSGCVIFETYPNAPGYAGQSFDIYDRSKGQWHRPGSIPPAASTNTGAVRRTAASSTKRQHPAVAWATGAVANAHVPAGASGAPDTVRQLGETSTDGGSARQVCVRPDGIRGGSKAALKGCATSSWKLETRQP